MADDIEISQTEETIDTNTAQPAPQAATSLTQEERDLIAAMPYEEARDKLVQAVRALENGGLSLDQSMRQWEIGEALAQRAESLLADVRARLDAAQAQQAQTASTAGTQENREVERGEQCAVIRATDAHRAYLPDDHTTFGDDVVDARERRQPRFVGGPAEYKAVAARARRVLEPRSEQVAEHRVVVGRIEIAHEHVLCAGARGQLLHLSE